MPSGSTFFLQMNPLAHKRQQILQQMELIQRMAYGSLQSETRPSKREPGQNRGPYFKLQLWENGKNVTQRISSEDAEALAQAIDGRKRFEQLAGEFIETTVAMTQSESSPGSKKNTTKSSSQSKRKPLDISNSS